MPTGELDLVTERFQTDRALTVSTVVEFLAVRIDAWNEAEAKIPFPIRMSHMIIIVPPRTHYLTGFEKFNLVGWTVISLKAHHYPWRPFRVLVPANKDKHTLPKPESLGPPGPCFATHCRVVVASSRGLWALRGFVAKADSSLAHCRDSLQKVLCPLFQCCFWQALEQ